MRSHNGNAMIVWGLLAMVGSVSPVHAYPRDPNNAALLYYQAFISLPKGEDQRRDAVEYLPNGADPNDQVRRYIKDCRPALDLATAASQIAACDWGLRYSQGYQMSLSHLSQIRALARLMRADAAIAVADGRYRQALDRCLTMRRIVQHTGDESLLSFLVGLAVNELADRAIQDAIGAMPPDPQTLVWLKGQLALVPSRQSELKNGLRTEQEIILAKFRAGSDGLAEAVTGSVDSVPQDLVEHIKNGDEAFFEGSRAYFKAHVDAALAVLDSTAPYGQRLARLEDLDKRPGLDAKQNPHARLTDVLMPSVARLLTLDTRARSNGSLLKTAIEIYLAKARTGSVPDQLAPGMPKDPFNGQDFKYEKTKEGFTLCRWTDDPSKDKTYQCAFKVK